MTLVCGQDRLLPFLDEKISEHLRVQVQRLGLSVLLKESAEEIDLSGPRVRLRLRGGGTVVLFATGRMGATRGLGLERVGIGVGPRGHLKVNEHYSCRVLSMRCRFFSWPAGWTCAGRPEAQTRAVFGRPGREGGLLLPPVHLPPARAGRGDQAPPPRPPRLLPGRRLLAQLVGRGARVPPQTGPRSSTCSTPTTGWGCPGRRGSCPPRRSSSSSRPRAGTGPSSPTAAATGRRSPTRPTRPGTARSTVALALETGVKRDVNRAPLDLEILLPNPADPQSKLQLLTAAHRPLLRARVASRAFHPRGSQRVLHISPAVFSLVRTSPSGDERVVCLTNVSGAEQEVDVSTGELGVREEPW